MVDPKIQEFIERAEASGAPEQSLVGILAARGWPEKEVYEALAAHYERTTGTEIPRRQGTGTAAKDAFFHLLVFSTLATWTIQLGALAFTLIDRWLADTLFTQNYSPAYEMSSSAESIASVLVAFPIYLLISRAVRRDESVHPDKLQSPVRKWLTYMALVIAACVFIGDLIAAVTYFLRGEITSRFLAKALVVLILSGGVFFYYFGGLRRSEGSEFAGNWISDRWMAGISSAAVIVMLVLGFSYVGSPNTQRTLRADQRRTNDVYQIASKINSSWNTGAQKPPPQHLDELHDVALADPVSRSAYEYRIVEGNRYELCATFAMASEAIPASTTWSHPAGRHCFLFDASRPPDNPGVYFPD